MVCVRWGRVTINYVNQGAVTINCVRRQVIISLLCEEMTNFNCEEGEVIKSIEQGGG